MPIPKEVEELFAYLKEQFDGDDDYDQVIMEYVNAAEKSYGGNAAAEYEYTSIQDKKLAVAYACSLGYDGDIDVCGVVKRNDRLWVLLSDGWHQIIGDGTDTLPE